MDHRVSFATYQWLALALLEFCAMAIILTPIPSVAQSNAVPTIEELEKELEKKKASVSKPKPAKPDAPKERPATTTDSATVALSGAMLSIRGETFRMGDTNGDGRTDEKPIHEVTIRSFRLGRTEVTRGQFRRFVLASGYRTEAERDVAAGGCLTVTLGVGSGKWDYRPGFSWRDPGFEQTDEHPVVCVSWNDAQAYIEWLNHQTHRHFRLPSEAEWEYAARAGSTAKYPWGMDGNQGCSYANGADQTPWPNNSGQTWSSKMECKDGYFFTAPVATYQANDYGLHDMIGNVWEWTQDCYHDAYSGAPSDATAWESSDCRGRVIRGGSWNSNPAYLRVSIRDWNTASDRFDFVGFRLAQDL